MAYSLALPSTFIGLARTRTARPDAPVAAVRGSGPALCRALFALRTWLLGQGYRPELHYMRGGRTPGCRSLARG